MKNRELKFRAWDIRNEVMWLRKPKQLVSEFFQLLEQDEEGGEQFVLMQYTGLKDRNGTEIYEGDIVKDDSIKSPYGHTGVVEWHGIGPWVGLHIQILPHLTSNESTKLTWSDKKLEVIGNVWENPGLLQPHKEARA